MLKASPKLSSMFDGVKSSYLVMNELGRNANQEKEYRVVQRSQNVLELLTISLSSIVLSLYNSWPGSALSDNTELMRTPTCW